MAVTRSNAAAYLHAGFALFAAEAGQINFDDSASGYGPDIDNALRALGVAESDLATATVADDRRAVYFALADYYAATRLVRRLGVRTSVSLGPARIDHKPMMDNLWLILRAATDALVPFGYGGGWSVGVWNFDWLEHDEREFRPWA